MHTAQTVCILKRFRFLHQVPQPPRKTLKFNMRDAPRGMHACTHAPQARTSLHPIGLKMGFFACFRQFTGAKLVISHHNRI